MADNYAQTNGIVVSVAVDKALYSYDVLFDYSVPLSLADKVKAGCRVIVPFGRANKKAVGMVFEVVEKSYDPNVVKPVVSVIDDRFILSEEMLGIVRWMKESTFCTYFDAIKTVIPTGLSFSVESKFELMTSDAELEADEGELLSCLKNAKNSRELDILVDGADKKLVKLLIDKGYIVKLETAKRRIGDETEKVYRLAADFETNDRLAHLSAKQKLVIEALSEASTASLKELCYICNVTSVVVKNLVKYGLIEEFVNELSRSSTIDAKSTRNIDDIVFSDAQQKVFDGLCELLNENAPRCALLYGITGSGKTSVFVRLISETLKKGQTAVMLVPEISLTPQTVSFFQQLFGNKVAIIHSGLSMGQRADEYKRINDGDARIVIGTRSAIFAPLKNIGIIVIDEEGEHS